MTERMSEKNQSPTASKRVIYVLFEDTVIAQLFSSILSAFGETVQYLRDLKELNNYFSKGEYLVTEAHFFEQIALEMNKKYMVISAAPLSQERIHTNVFSVVQPLSEQNIEDAFEGFLG
jgi:hypothetical protein